MGIWSRIGAAALSAIAVLGAPAGYALAGTLTFTGTMTGTVNGNPFTGATFSAVTSFNWDDDVGNMTTPSYPSTLSVTLSGDPSYAGTYTSAPGTEIFTVLIAPAVAHGFEIQDDGDGTVGAFFASVTNEPNDTVLWSGLSDPFQSGEFDVPLTDAGTLVVTGFPTLGDSISIFVPEPGTFALLGFAALATGLGSRRRRRAFRPGWWYRDPQWQRMFTQRRISTVPHKEP